MPNKTYLDGKLIYSDESFRPSPLYEIDTPEVMVSFLGFLVTRKGDVSSDFFEQRNCPELDKWANESSECEEIRLMINDFEESTNDSFLAENEMTYEEARIIESYIEIF